MSPERVCWVIFYDLFCSFIVAFIIELQQTSNQVSCLLSPDLKQIFHGFNSDTKVLWSPSRYCYFVLNACTSWRTMLLNETLIKETYNGDTSFSVAFMYNAFSFRSYWVHRHKYSFHYLVFCFSSCCKVESTVERVVSKCIDVHLVGVTSLIMVDVL
jgi:hypothetical protein